MPPDASRTITVVINGPGAVASAPSGIACTDRCSLAIAGPVTLTASPGGAFGIAWDNGCTGATCVVDGTADVTVGVQFAGTPDVTGANLVFVTQAAHDGAFQAAGDLDGIAGANRFCQATAAAAGLSGTFVAFMSSVTAGKNAIDQLAGASGWVRLDGAVVYGTLADVAAAHQLHPVDRDEHGGYVYGLVWQGEDQGGTRKGADCNGFSSKAGSDTATVLFTVDVEDDGAISTTGCDTQESVTCLQIDHAADLTPPSFPVGRFAFVSTAKWPRDTGATIAGADAACAAEAAAAGLPGRYVSGLATATQTLASRIGGVAGPWRRPDGVLIAFGSLADELGAPIDVTAAGRISNPRVWSGSSHLDTATTLGNCSDWTTGDPGVSGLLGWAVSSNVRWLDYAVFDCSSNLSVDCFQRTSP